MPTTAWLLIRSNLPMFQGSWNLNRRRLGGMAAGLLLFLATAFSVQALAPPLVVTTTADGNNGDCTVALCTLRDAVIKANATPGADVITLPANASPYTLTIGGTNEDAAATGDLDVAGTLTINGGGAATTIVDGGSIDRVFHVRPGGNLTLNDLTVRHGLATGSTNEFGGGIYSEFSGGTVVLNSVVVTMNTAGGLGSSGGGVYVDFGSLTIVNSTISGNHAGSGGGVFVTNGSTATILNTTITVNGASVGGGGAFVEDTTLSLTDCTVSGNMVTGTSGFGGGVAITSGAHVNMSATTISGNSLTGGVGLGAGIENEATLTMVNCTVSGNAIVLADGPTGVEPNIRTGGIPFGGGGIFNQGTASLTSSTVASNFSPTDGGGNLQNVSGTTTLKNTIVANPLSGGNCSGPFADAGTNLQFPGTSCGPAPPFTSADPLLGPLAANGGPTQTHALTAGSAAIDQGTTGCLPVPPADQRGVSRPQGVACDIGSFELQGAVTNTPTPTNTPAGAPTSTPSNTPTGTPTNSPTVVASFTPTPGAVPTLVPTLSLPMLALLALALAGAAILILRR